jgi:hypothetical protein
MLSLIYCGHKIEVDTIPMQVIYYDGIEVSKKAAFAGASTHLFSITENNENVKYEINLSSIIGGTTLSGYGRNYDIRRNGKILFNSNATTFTLPYNGHKIELKENRFPIPKKIVAYDGKEIASKVILVTVGSLGSFNIPFSVVENNEQTEYEVSFSITGTLKTNYKVRRNGDLILINDSSISTSNASTAVDGGSKVAGNIAGGIAGGLMTGGAGPVSVLSSGITSGLTDSILKDPELTKNIGAVKDVVDIVKKISDKK